MMARSRTLPLVLGTLLLGFIGFAFVFGAGGSAVKPSPYKYLGVFEEVYKLVRGSYVDPVDDEALMSGACRGVVGGLDIFSGYLTREEFQKLKTDAGKGLARTGIEVLRVPGGALVVAVAAGSEAERAGVKIGDQLWSIDGVPTRQLSLLQVRSAQRGAEDSTVRVLVYHPKTQKRDDLTIRRTIPSAPAFESRLLDGKIAYVRVFDLQRTGIDQMRAALTTLKKKGGTRLLLDMRGCASGGVEDAVRLAGLFLPAGPVVSVQERASSRVLTVKETRLAPVWSLPVSILQNGGSAGGAEVLVEALHSRLKAPILGETSYGLGSIQDLVPLPGGDGLVLSISKLVGPGGESWNKTGLEPDTRITSTPDERAGSEPDSQLEKAIELLRPAIPKAA